MLRLSSQSRPCRMPLCAAAACGAACDASGLAGAVANGGGGTPLRGNCRRQAGVLLGRNTGRQRLCGVGRRTRLRCRQAQIRMASSASTRLRLSARRCPIRMAAQTASPRPSGRWRRRLDRGREQRCHGCGRRCESGRRARSGCRRFQPCCQWPIFSSIAAASHGVAMSRLIGPAPSRHHSAPKQPTKMTTTVATAPAVRFSQRPAPTRRRNAPNPKPKR